MAAAFRPVNHPLLAVGPTNHGSATSPMTPRPNTAPTPPPKHLAGATTPTRASFGTSALASQKPLPTSPFPESVQVPEPATTMTSKRGNSQHSTRSRESDDVDMDESDEEGHDDGAVSDEESVNADGTKSKKKKSQRFYCTDYPPCNLSFTRSEHLARHIRKHTGERPFQCHCSRRFSRLDNLRQHAQTVHVNEDIPIDSLAATGARFQRQIRTERVRQPGRARAATAGSVGHGGRGHSKSLSTSSITSVGSIASGYSVNDARRRPPPLIMADSRSRLSLESYRGGDAQYYRGPSPSDFSTPTSATFSTGQNSPRWGSIVSPGSTHSRSHSMYAGSRTPGRRLSVPSGGNPFQSPHGPSARGPPFNPSAFNSSNNGAFSPSQNGLLSSPTISTSGWSRRDSVSSTADEAWRRRTWHPDTRDYSGSRLSQVITPSQFPPDTVSLAPPNRSNQPPYPVRLPGIESFDGMRPPTPPRRHPSPMMIDSEGANPPVVYPGGDVSLDDRRGLTTQWDMNLHRGLTRLDINTPPRDSAGTWANEANQALLARVDQARAHPTQQVRFDTEVKTVQAPPSSMPPTNTGSGLGSRHHYTMSAPSASVLRESKRHGWYNGPAAAHPASQTIHEGRPHVDRIVHPNVSAFQGFPAREEQPVIHQQAMPRMERAAQGENAASQGSNSESLRRLEALVAVATGESSVATAC